VRDSERLVVMKVGYFFTRAKPARKKRKLLNPSILETNVSLRTRSTQRDDHTKGGVRERRVHPSMMRKHKWVEKIQRCANKIRHQKKEDEASDRRGKKKSERSLLVCKKRITSAKRGKKTGQSNGKKGRLLEKGTGGNIKGPRENPYTRSVE